jgi:hypothetical protein
MEFENRRRAEEMSQKKFDYRVTISAEYRRTYDPPEDIQDMIEAMLTEEGFRKIKVSVKGIPKK